jgi:hypothetical protein
VNDLWKVGPRPGFFGRRKDEIVAGLDARHGKGNWQLRWILPAPMTQFIPEQVDLSETWDFRAACVSFYEESYFRHLKANPKVVDEICQHSEVYDNALTNVQSGFDYTKQEAFSTHIQDIAIRNSLHRLNRRFSEDKTSPLLQVRGPDSKGWWLGVNPGQVQFFNQPLIVQPSLAPTWAGAGSVEDFWQSNKYIVVRK